ncbi:conserved hypothetical protein [Histoplasma capsulatum H143]|uniref:Uncharacterized protein n=1 Tax=Ajellomyces capsulatus (strain H143) TaxID=544712 RepID=C6HFG7_AJECH|nr:conserved hypothetical protein [Histoplasma capsulatum H143]
MALTQPVSPPARQPFGVIDPSRLRFLQSAKNQQNDPSAFNTPSAKRARGTGDEDVSKTAPGTVTNNSSRINRNHPKVWDFEIYTDTEQDEMANLMEHSTCMIAGRRIFRLRPWTLRGSRMLLLMTQG